MVVSLSRDRNKVWVAPSRIAYVFVILDVKVPKSLGLIFGVILVMLTAARVYGNQLCVTMDGWYPDCHFPNRFVREAECRSINACQGQEMVT